MKKYKGLYLPDREEHLIEWMEKVGHERDGKPTYQHHKYEKALKYVKNRGVAVDVGAHCGLWSRVMCLDFDRVVAFEPVPAHQECWYQNVPLNAHLHRVALGEKKGTCRLFSGTEGSSGDTWVSDDGVDARMATLDSYRIPMDFLKIDNEGYEYFVLKGGEETIRASRPAVIVEQKPGMAQRFGLRETQAVELLESWGAKVREAIQGDYILSWD